MLPRLSRLVLACTLMVGCAATGATKDETVEQKGRNLIAALVRGDFVEATKDFGEEMRNGLPPEMLGDTWKSLLSRTGPFESIRYVAERPADGGLRLLIIRCQFKNQDIDTLVTFDSKPHVVGLFFRPPST